MLPTEGTDGIDDTVHVRDRYILHVAVKFSESCFDLLRIQLVVLAIGIPEHLQNGMDIALAVVGWIGFNVSSQKIVIVFQGDTSSRILVMLPYRKRKYNCQISQI